MNTQLIPLPSTLLAQMPSGRDMYRPKPYVPPELDAAVLASTRAPPPEQSSHAQPGRIPMADGSSDEDVAASERPISRAPLPGSYPAPSASADSSRSTSQYY